mmetsp:Transcript_28823/g.63743  ORF Transcript_28823/g.63743 Transcript_28823/m.63743 type:complete len:565 (+) Transcript_28823:4-1698(+)
MLGAIVAREARAASLGTGIMVALLKELPCVKRCGARDDAAGFFKASTTVIELTAPMATRAAPPYGRRQGWHPRSLADFSDGGAFPEIPILQYPLEIGKRRSSSQKVVALNMDENGHIRWEAVIKQGDARDKLQVWTRPEDVREKWSKDEDLERPGMQLDQINTERTRKALQMQLNGAIQAGLPQKRQDKVPEFVRYTPDSNAPGYTLNCKERVVRISERQRDPLEPPKFKHKKIPRGPPSPPPPVMHSPARKLTSKDQQDWKISPCISNWKNLNGYIIPLDKRLLADGRNLQDVTVNDRFAALNEDLYLAERKAREEIKVRNEMQKQRKVREEEMREMQLRKLAAEARQQRAELTSSKGRVGEGESAAEATQRQQRMAVMTERQREIERDQRLEMAGKKNKQGREEDRDVSERIALGQAAQPTSLEVQYDARLFNQSAGMDSGFHGGSDEKNILYEKPLFADRSQSGIYRFDKQRLDQAEGRLAHIGVKSFAGAADGEPQSVEPRNAPVEFECEDSEPRHSSIAAASGHKRLRSRSCRRKRGGGSDDECDDFGLDGLLEETRKQ